LKLKTQNVTLNILSSLNIILTFIKYLLADESESYDEFGNLKKKTQAMEESITKKLYQTKNDNIMIKINSDIKNRTKSFFKFMIEQNPNFTDLEKLEEEYKKQIKESFEILNEKKIKIQKKIERMAEIERASTNVK